MDQAKSTLFQLMICNPLKIPEPTNILIRGQFHSMPHLTNSGLFNKNWTLGIPR